MKYRISRVEKINNQLIFTTPRNGILYESLAEAEHAFSINNCGNFSNLNKFGIEELDQDGKRISEMYRNVEELRANAPVSAEESALNLAALVGKT